MASKPPNCRRWLRWVTWEGREPTSLIRRSLASLGSQLGCQSTLLNLLVVMVSSVHDEIVWIVGTLFVQNEEILKVDPSQTEPSFEVTILNPYSWGKIISNGI